MKKIIKNMINFLKKRNDKKDKEISKKKNWHTRKEISKKKNWHTRYEWPVNCFDKIKIEIELVTGKYIIGYTCGYGFTNINDNFVSYGIIWVKRWRFLGKEKKIKNI